MQQLVAIALGGSLGALARFGLSTYIMERINDIFPWGTLVINLIGSFLIGVVAELSDAAIVPANLRSFITIGFLGAYTTFSTFSLETMSLLRDGELRLAAFNMLGSNLAAMILVALGMYVSRFIIKTIA